MDKEYEGGKASRLRQQQAEKRTAVTIMGRETRGTLCKGQVLVLPGPRTHMGVREDNAGRESKGPTAKGLVWILFPSEERAPLLSVSAP